MPGPTPDPPVRLFVALDLPDAVRAPLAAWPADLPGARRVAPERLHLTLRFLGETTSEAAARVEAQLRGLSAAPVPVRTGDLLRLPSARRPRALTVRVETSPELAALARGLDAALRRAGAPPADHDLLPHVTLARFRQPDPAALRKALRGLEAPRAEGVARSVSLVESVQTPEGPRYVPLLRVGLEETARPPRR